MAALHPDVVLRHLRRLAAWQQSDAELLGRFIACGDGDAFAALVRRHGPLVLSVCRSVLGHEQDAEDAFQATFLVLARKAGSVRKRAALSSWLHGVAYRLAREALARAAQRRLHERQPRAEAAPAAMDDLTWRELRAALHEEVQRLPERNRLPLLLCYWEGLTQEEAAKRLGLPKETLKHRLERAREMLRSRLERRGLAPAVPLLAAGLTPSAVSATLVETTTQAGVLYVAGGAVSGAAVALTEAGTSALGLSKVKLLAGLLLLSAVLAAGMAGPARQALTQPAPQVKPPETVAQQPQKAAEKQVRLDLFGDPLPEGAIARIGTSRLRDSASTCVIAFSPDGRQLAYGNENGLIHVCEAADGKPLFDFQPDKVNCNPVTELAFSPDGRTLAVGGYWYEALWLIDLATRKIRHTIPNTAPRQNLWGRAWQGPGFAFTPDGGTLVVGGKDGALHLWDAATGTEQATLQETTEPVLSLALTANGHTALTAHRGGAIHLWDVPGRKQLRQLAGSTKLPHLYLTALAPDGKTVALAPEAAVLELWDPDGGRRHQLRTAAPVVGLSFTSDGASLLVADGDGCVTVWDVQTGKKRTALSCEGISLRGTDGHIQPRPSAWFRSDGKVMAWAVVGAVRLWSLATGQETPRPLLCPQGIRWAGFSADGRLLYAGGVNGELGVWDAATGRQHGPLRKTPPTPGARYSPAADRRRVVVVTARRDMVTMPQTGEGRIFLWDPTGEAGPVQLREQSKPAGSAALTPDHRFIVAPQVTGRIQVYDGTTEKPPRSFDGHKNEYRPTFSPDGRLLATTAPDGVMCLYDFATGRLLRELKGQSPAGCLAFSPDSRTLASGHFTIPKELGPSDEAIYLWDTATGRELQRIPARHGGGVQDLSLSPDGRLLASCGLDGAVRLWETASGQERRRYQGHRSWALSIDFAPDGGRLVSASLDGTAVVWQVFDHAAADRPAADLDVLWADLGKDGVAAHRAMSVLIAAKGTAAFLDVQVKAAGKPSAERLKAWIADLDSTEFKAREQAMKELARQGVRVEATLREVLADKPTLEVQRRITTLLEKLAPAGSPESLRLLRSIEALEHIGTAEVRKTLTRLTKDAPRTWLEREAKASLERLAKRSH
jgi:RNA polymerase sigma factor (sigma-70 family)